MNDPVRPEVSDSRLRPEMASLRLKVLAFVRGYIEREGGSPSYGEIAAALAISREGARKAVKRLIRAGELERVPGPRGLVLPGAEALAVATLARAGWRIDRTGRALTDCPLPGGFDLDYVAENEIVPDRPRNRRNRRRPRQG